MHTLASGGMGVGQGQQSRAPAQGRRCMQLDTNKEENSQLSGQGLRKPWNFEVPEPNADRRAQAHSEFGMPPPDSPGAYCSLIKGPLQSLIIVSSVTGEHA